jgi:hypothetical protein
MDMQMSPHRIPILFPESLRSHLFFVKISSEARARGENAALEQSHPVEQREKEAPARKRAGTQGVPSSPLND